MRTAWEALQQSLVRLVESQMAATEFEWIQRRPLFARFASPVALATELDARTGELDERDRLYGELLRISQGHRSGARLASALLWLGLWPGLASVYRRLIRRHSMDPGEAASEVGFQFLSAVASADQHAIRRVAATLVRNTERRVFEARLQRRLIAMRESTPLAQAVSPDSATPEPVASAGPSEGVSEEQQVRNLHARLASVVGRDAELVVANAVYDESPGMVAARSGLGVAATRKRLQRAYERLRETWRAHDDCCPTFGSSNRV
jgi:DNA-directed RNA polymerase specialized sigma24 family protein